MRILRRLLRRFRDRPLEVFIGYLQVVLRCSTFARFPTPRFGQADPQTGQLGRRELPTAGTLCAALITNKKHAVPIPRRTTYQHPLLLACIASVDRCRKLFSIR